MDKLTKTLHEKGSSAVTDKACNLHIMHVLLKDRPSSFVGPWLVAGELSSHD